MFKVRGIWTWDVNGQTGVGRVESGWEGVVRRHREERRQRIVSRGVRAAFGGLGRGATCVGFKEVRSCNVV